MVQTKIGFAGVGPLLHPRLQRRNPEPFLDALPDGEKLLTQRAKRGAGEEVSPLLASPCFQAGFTILARRQVFRDHDGTPVPVCWIEALTKRPRRRKRRENAGCRPRESILDNIVGVT